MMILRALSIFILSWNAFAGFPSEYSEKVQALIKKHESEKRFAGVSIAIVNAENESIIIHSGLSDIENQKVPHDETFYEIGSVSKTFTRLLFANQTKILPDDLIGTYLPTSIRSPEITFENLLTHTSFAISIPCTYRLGNENPICFGMDLNQVADPYKDTTRELLFQFVNEYSFTVDEFNLKAPGLFYSYSNVGTGLLGELLAQENHTTYEKLLKQEILDVLGMSETHVESTCLPPLKCQEFAKVYFKDSLEADWKQGNLWHLPGLPGAGGIRSNLKEMMIYLKANLGLYPTALDETLFKGQAYLPAASAKANTNICKDGETRESNFCNEYPQHYYNAWEGLTPGTFLYHAGSTGSSQTMMIFAQDRSIGIVVLSNSALKEGENTLTHYPNNLSLCLLQMAGKPIARGDFCSEL